MNPYETRQYLNEYLLLHYGTPAQRCPFPFAPRHALPFHQRLITECLLPVRFPHPTRGLDIGCAVGRVTFELAGVVDEAIGIDNAASLIRAAQRIARTGRATIERQELGDQSTRLTVTLPRHLRRRNVAFCVGDAQRIDGGPFDVVLGVNLLCRLPRPRRFLKQLPGLVVPGGQLVLASPHSWLTQYTPRSEWLTSAEVRESLAPSFRLVRRRDLPFLIRETQRRYQWVVSDVLTFVRKETARGTLALQRRSLAGERPASRRPGMAAGTWSPSK